MGVYLLGQFCAILWTLYMFNSVLIWLLEDIMGGDAPKVAWLLRMELRPFALACILGVPGL